MYIYVNIYVNIYNINIYTNIIYIGVSLISFISWNVVCC